MMEQYDVVFIIEDTVSCKEDFSTLYNSYILPSVRFFNNGINPADIAIFGSQRQPSQYSLLTLQNQFRQDVGMNPGKITQNASDFLMKIKNLRFANGGIASGCFLSEALATALQVFKSMSELRKSIQAVKHVVIITNTAPFMTPVIRNCPQNGLSFDKLLDVFNKESICISVLCGRHILAYKEIFRKLYSDFANIFSKSVQYASHANHMILVKGIQLPVQDVVDVDVFALNKNESKLDAGINIPNKKIKIEDTSTINVTQAYSQPIPARLISHPQVSSQHNQSNNQNSVVNSGTQQIQVFPRKVVWSGQLQWNETNLNGDGGKISRILPCKATVHFDDTLQANDWPTDLHMQLIPQQYLQSLARFVKQAKQVMFTFSTSDNEILQSMYRIMNGSPASGIPGTTGQKFAGCVFLNNPSDQTHVKVLLLIFSPKKKAFIGVIPEEQQQFVGELRAIISEDKSRTVKQQIFPNALAQSLALRNLPVSSSNQFAQQQYSHIIQQYQQNSQLKYLLQQHQQQIQLQQPNQQLQQQAQLQQQTQLTQQIQQQTQLAQPQMTQMNQHLQQSQQMQLQAQNSRINQKWPNQQLQQQILLQQQQQTQQQQQQQQQQIVAAIALAQQQEQQQTGLIPDVQIYNEFLGNGC